MFKRVNKIYTLFLLLDIGLTLLALGLAKFARETIPVGIPLGGPLLFSPWLYLIVTVIWILVFTSFRIYSPVRLLHHKQSLSSVWGAVTAASFTFAGVSYLIFRVLSRLLFVYFYVLDVAFLCGWRWLRYRFFGQGNKLYGTDQRRVLIVGTDIKGQQLGQAISACSTTDLILVGFVEYLPQETRQDIEEFSVLGITDDVPRLVEEYQLQEIIFSVSPSQHSALRSLVLKLQDAPVNLRIIPDAFDLAVLRGPIEDFEGIPIAALSDFPLFDHKIHRQD